MFNGRPNMLPAQGQVPGGRMPFAPAPYMNPRGPGGPPPQGPGQTGPQNPLLQNIAPFSVNPTPQPYFPTGNELPPVNGVPYPPPRVPGFGMPPRPPGGPMPMPPQMPFGAPPMPGQVPNFRAVPPPAGPPTFAKEGKRERGSGKYGFPAAQESKVNYDPESVVTIFIGNIDERASEILMRNLIQKCGNVANWKRVHGANNKLQAFGFCDFFDAESALRAIRLLDKVRLAARDLQVKIGNKQHPLILAYQTVMKSRLGPDAPEDAVDEGTKLQDQVLAREIQIIIDDHEDELSKPLPEEKALAARKKSDKDASIEEIEMEDDKRQLISREIQNFRDTYKGSDEVLEERIKAAGRAQRKPVGERGDSPTSNASVDTTSGNSSQKRPPRKSRSPSPASSSSSEEVVNVPSRRRDIRRLAELEKEYQDQLEKWLDREKRVSRERDKDDSRERSKRSEEKKNAKRLIRVYEDYDDDKMDNEFYGGKALARLIKDREKELDADKKDRERETKMLEELKQRLIDEGRDSFEAEEHVKKVELEQNEHMISQNFKEALSSLNEPNSSLNEPISSPLSKESLKDSDEIKQESQSEGLPNSTISFQQATSRLAKRMHGSNTMFSQSDEEGEEPDKRKRLFRNDEEVDRKRVLSDQRKAQAKRLIESIPTRKEELFDYPISWDSLDKSLMDGRVKPWINKKIQEYIGEEEQTLVEFIAQKISSRATPRSIIGDISMVLDEDAEIFVVKLWRLLVYETEMKKAMPAEANH
ncbi:RNA-binding protein 25-like isoform X2 [Paramacrobiotus metropolitanus]|nr:RNA-binding protein 25-like isoform X2 [Paramacrobiotus metropolitanus]